jgi:hypothetical protein
MENFGSRRYGKHTTKKRLDSEHGWPGGGDGASNGRFGKGRDLHLDAATLFLALVENLEGRAACMPSECMYEQKWPLSSDRFSTVARNYSLLTPSFVTIPHGVHPTTKRVVISIGASKAAATPVLG